MTGSEIIRKRKSIRKYSEKQISDTDIKVILSAAMSGPSCANTKDWSFIVVRDKTMLGRMADANGQYAKPLIGADVGILVCGDLSCSFPAAPDYWIIDAAIAAQNMIFMATELGIGSVWLGTYPQMEQVENMRELFQLPEYIMPHSVLAFGYPADQGEFDREGRDKYDEGCVHYETW